MDRPQELEVDEDAEIVERVAAIDVAKATGMVCTRVPHASAPGKRVTKVWEVKATTKGITELAEHLVSERVERVVLESTSDYWRPFLYVLEGAGLVVWLVNAKQVKNVPGRPKTDKLDSVWLAKLAERSMLSPSFVPEEQMRHVRDLARARFDLVEDRTRVKQRVEKVLEDALVKISSVLTDLHGVSGRAMIEALINGERDPMVLAELAKGRARARLALLADRSRHGGLLHRAAALLVGEDLAPHRPVRTPEPQRADRQGQPLPEGRPWPDGHRRREDRHLLGRALPKARQAHAQGKGARGDRALHPRRHLPPAQ